VHVLSLEIYRGYASVLKPRSTELIHSDFKGIFFL